MIALVRAESPTDQNAPLTGVLRRESDVFASNRSGLYRATVSSSQWVKLTLPKGMASGGRFGTAPDDSDVVFYITSKHDDIATKDRRDGLYLSDDDGQTWRLVSPHPDYGSVRLLPNGSLFAVTNPLNGSVHLSKDLGIHWQDISANCFGIISDLFPDPDNPGQICLHANSIRFYVMQAPNDQYPSWNAIREWDWHPEQNFFQRAYSSRDTYHELGATLNNYFKHAFGNKIRIPAIALSVDTANLSFTQGQPVIVPVTVWFLEDLALKQWYKQRDEPKDAPNASPKPVEIALVDDQKSTANGVWSVHVEYRGMRSRNRPEVKAPSLKAHPLSQRSPYHRELKLSEIYDFSGTGSYTVQIRYNNWKLANTDDGEWGGSFTSPVFQVVIDPTN